MDIRDQMPESCKNSFQTSDMNLESRSETMSVGSPWYFHTSLAKMTARSVAVFPSSLRGRKCAILVNLSMTTHNWLLSSNVGSSVMKSIAIDCQGAYGNSSGEDSP